MVGKVSFYFFLLLATLTDEARMDIYGSLCCKVRSGGSQQFWLGSVPVKIEISYRRQGSALQHLFDVRPKFISHQFLSNSCYRSNGNARPLI